MHRFLNEQMIVQFGLLLVAGALYASTFTQSFTFTGAAHSPMFFPRIILTLWIGLNVISLIKTYLSARPSAPIANWWRIGLVVIAAFVYTNVIGSEGFFLPSVAFALVCLPAFSIRNPVLIGLFAIAVPGALVLLFNHVLGMPLPTSRFTYYF